MPQVNCSANQGYHELKGVTIGKARYWGTSKCKSIGVVGRGGNSITASSMIVGSNWGGIFILYIPPHSRAVLVRELQCHPFCSGVVA